MPAEEGYLLWDAALLVERDDRKSAAAARLPINGEIFWICLYTLSACPASASGKSTDLDQVGVPCVLRNAQVVVALLLFSPEVSTRREEF